MSEIHKVLGRPILGWEMQMYGLPLLNIAGIFKDDDYPGSVDLMLAAAQAFSHLIHPTSRLKDGSILNKYVDGALYYQLRLGNNDPEIVIKYEYASEDLPQGEHQLYLPLCGEDAFTDLSDKQLKLLEWAWQRKKPA